MTTWAPSKRARSERVEAEAESLIRDLGDLAYQEARRREHEASSDAIAEDWALVAKAIARKTGSRVGLNLIDSTGDEHFLRAGSRAGRGPQGSTPSRARGGTATHGGRRSHAAAVPDPVHGRRNRFHAFGLARRRDPRLRRLRRDHRRRDRRVAAPHDRACAFSIAKGARFSAGRKPPADKGKCRPAYSAAATASRSRTSKISNSSLRPRSCEDRGVVR